MDILKTETEINIPAPWGNIAGLTWGDPTKPPVLLVHGRMQAGSMYRPLVTLLPRDFYYVTFDLPSNGKSDHLPRGPKLSVLDLVPSVYFVVRHFKWKTFIYIGHSLGVIIGKYFNMAYPNYVSRFVEIDPIPAYHTWRPNEIGDSFLRYYHTHYVDKYQIYIKGPDTAPTYTYQQAMDLLTDMDVNEESAGQIFDRITERVGDDSYRFTYDQRMKDVAIPIATTELLHKMYTSTKVPILCILAKDTIDLHLYERAPFIMDRKAWRHKNYSYMIVEGGHNVGLTNPERFSKRLTKFLLQDVKSKY